MKGQDFQFNGETNSFEMIVDRGISYGLDMVLADPDFLVFEYDLDEDHVVELDKKRLKKGWP